MSAAVSSDPNMAPCARALTHPLPRYVASENHRRPFRQLGSRGAHTVLLAPPLAQPPRVIDGKRTRRTLIR